MSWYKELQTILSLLDPFDIIVIFYCIVILAIYQACNPNLDAEREFYDDPSTRTYYYIIKYTRYLLDFVLIYYAYNIGSLIITHYTKNLAKIR